MAKKRKKSNHNREVLTIGEVARVCRVSDPTAISWFEKGLLKGYRVPPRGDRKIYRSSLIEFMEKHGIDFKLPDITQKASKPSTPRPSVSPSILAGMEKDYKGGMTYAGLAEKYGRPATTIKRWLHSKGLQSRRRGPRS